MYYPDEIIEEVRQRSDIVDVIGSYIKLKRTGSNYQGLCPFHNEKTPSFSVNQPKQIYKCFGCGKAGNVITFVMEYENMSFPDALKLLADRAGVQLPKAEYSEEMQKTASLKASLHEIYKTAAIYYHSVLRSPQGSEGYAYLKSRQLSDETIVKFGLGYSPKSNSLLYRKLKDAGYKEDVLKASELFSYNETAGARDKFWNRVMFPIMDINNKVIAFGGRVMGDGIPKYLNSNETKIFEKSRNLYAMNIARRSRSGYLLLCEGYMDVIALHQAGFDNAVASLGTALTGLQANLMSRYTKKVIITYDSDEAGTKAALRAIPILKGAGLTVKVLRMAPYKDPDEFIKALGRGEYQKRIDEAMSAFNFELSCMEKGFDLDNPEEKTRFFNEVAKKMLEFTDELERTNYCQAVAKHYNISYDEFRRLVNRMAVGIDVNNVTVMPERRQSPDGKNSKNGNLNKDRLECERLIFTWSMEAQKYCDVMREYLDLDAFQEGIPRRVAELSYKQAEESGGKLTPASLVSCFETVEEQMSVSDLFQTEIWEQMEDDKSRDKAFAEAMGRILEMKNKELMNEASRRGDNNAVMECMLAKKKISAQVKNIISRLAE
ncbi:MAG: DNA primase [Lachnospiraceae bacterium]